MPEPKCAWQSARVAAKSASRASSWVMTTARGIPTISHSCHSARLCASAPSAAETTKRAASAALSPARTSPTKSGLPGASRRVTTTDPLRQRGGPQAGRGLGLAPCRPPGHHRVDDVVEQPGLSRPARSDEDDVADARRAGGRWGPGSSCRSCRLHFTCSASPHKRAASSVTGSAATAPLRWTHHAEPIRARLLHQAADPGGRGAHPARHQPRRRHDHRHPRGVLRRPGLLPARRVPHRHARHHGLRLRRHPRRHHGPPHRSLRQVGRLPRLHARPGRRRRHLRRARAVLRRRAGQGLHGRPRPGLPHPRQRRVLRQGARRGARHDRQRRHRRARRPARRRARWPPAWSAGSCPRSCSPWCSGCSPSPAWSRWCSACSRCAARPWTSCEGAAAAGRATRSRSPGSASAGARCA